MKKNILTTLPALVLLTLGLSFGAVAVAEDENVNTTISTGDVVINSDLTLKAFDGSAEFLNNVTQLWGVLRIEEFDGSLPTQDSIDLRLTQEEMSHVPGMTDERKIFIKTLKYQIQALPLDLMVNVSDNLYLIEYKSLIVGIVRHVAGVQDGEEADWLDRLYIQPRYLSEVQPAILEHFSSAYAYILTGVSGLTDEFQGYLDAGWVVRDKVTVNKKYKNFELPAVIIDGPAR